MTQKIVGHRLTVCFVEDVADEASDDKFKSVPSWREAISHLEPARADSAYARMNARLKRLANYARLRSPDQFRKEGTLPDGKDFYAVKAGKVRCYGWYSTKYKGVFIVSHFAFKQQKKLDPADERRVNNSWARIEKGE
ncbi:hypothetical protein [Alcanivorax sp.]|uniref:hypothetical protein n=1 Tax=Alcanivorax sp. TaxID=1872427 RepID=UPI002582B6F8|nr:hypothetical protein [Alcanivorax sp.]